ncbi:MAG: VanZ family protein [Chloroflexi bacterium]|nr:VanZ family protein [Chloroflexota bacterium]
MLGTWLSVGVWMTLILLNSSVPGTPSTLPGPLTTLFGKGGHVVEYSVLGLLVTQALSVSRGGLRVSARPAVAMAVVLCVAFALADELRQLFVPGRAATLSDPVLDGISAFAGAWGCRRFVLVSRPREAEQAASGREDSVACERSDEQVHR